jgi:invasion protein IalB
MVSMSIFSRPRGRAVAVAACAAFAMVAADAAFAQAPAPQAKPPARPRAAPARPAQQAATPAVAPINPNVKQPEWLKVCGHDDNAKADICQVTSYILGDAGNVVGEVRLFEAKQGKETKRVFEALVPPGFLIQPGVNLVIDDNKQPVPGRYRVCFPNLCLAEVPISDDTLAKLRKGKLLTFFVANAQGQWVGARVALTGFGATYEGAALDPKVYDAKRKEFEESQNKLQSELAKRAEEQRKKLQEQQTSQAPGAAPAAPAAPAKP